MVYQINQKMLGVFCEAVTIIFIYCHLFNNMERKTSLMFIDLSQSYSVILGLLVNMRCFNTNMLKKRYDKR